MAANGVTTTDVSELNLVDELIGNRQGTTGRIAADKLASQLLGDGPIADTVGQTATSVAALETAQSTMADRIEAVEEAQTSLQAGQSSDRIIATSWIDLRDNFTGGFNGQGAEVLPEDTGDHSQGTATGYDGATVDNMGLYSWNDSWGVWVWISTNAITAKADRSEVAYLFTVEPVNLELVGGTVREKGEIVTPELSWELETNGETAPTTALTVEDGSGPESVGTGDTSWTGDDVSETTTFTVTATDEVSRDTSASTTMYFYNRLFWGAASSASLDSAGVIGLAQSALSNVLARTMTLDASADPYVYYAWPAAYGDPTTVTVGGFALDASGYTLSTVSVTTAAGHTEDYRVLRLAQQQSGTVLLEVS